MVGGVSEAGWAVHVMNAWVAPGSSKDINFNSHVLARFNGRGWRAEKLATEHSKPSSRIRRI